MIIAVAGHKGGTGKTTVAVTVAAELYARGQSVLLVDADPQGTALMWAEMADQAKTAGPTTVAMGDNLRSQLPKMAEGYDWTVIDCPGRVGRRQIAALMVADMALLPCGPSAADVWALNESTTLIGEARELRPELRVAVVFNRADRTTMGANARAAIESLGLHLLPASLGDRVAFREALAAGQGVTLYASGSTAATEARKLVDTIECFGEEA
ncbi:MAG: AAA family ATPase [Sandaracinaceae bacterium]|nr:AAA family ATPase [Sandaracinaceae bacterium]